MKLQLSRQESPIGEILVVSDGETLRALDFHDCEARLHRLLRLHYGTATLLPGAMPTGIARSLDAYFAGDLTALDDIVVQTGGTPFQRQIWAALRGIKPGTTTTYGALAARIGRASASRAVGMANGANPIAIVLPCHRVIGANASLTGYGGGLPRKAWLLDHERRYAGELTRDLLCA